VFLVQLAIGVLRADSHWTIFHFSFSGVWSALLDRALLILVIINLICILVTGDADEDTCLYWHQIEK